MGKNGLPSTTSLPSRTAARCAGSARAVAAVVADGGGAACVVAAAARRPRASSSVTAATAASRSAGGDGDVLAAQPLHAVRSACCPRSLRAAARARRSGSGARAPLRRREQHLDGDLRPGAPGRVRGKRPRAPLRPHPVADALAVQHERARGAALVVGPLARRHGAAGASRPPSVLRGRRRGAARARNGAGGRGPRRRRAGRRGGRRERVRHARAARPARRASRPARSRPELLPSRRPPRRRTRRLRTPDHQPSHSPRTVCSKQTKTAPTA